MFGVSHMKVEKESGSNLDHINPLWAAPEVLKGHPYTTVSDVYAMGVMLWEIVTREDPYEEVVSSVEGRLTGLAFLKAAKERVLADERPKLPKDTST